MQELVVKCDICLKQIETKKEGRQLVANLNSGLREDGVHTVIFNWKDICDDCSFKLVSLLRNFRKEKNNE